MTVTLQVTDAEYALITKHLSEFLPGKSVWAYGSRTKGKAGQYSDLDLVVFGAISLEISDTSEAFQESLLPFVVSIFSWEKLPETFRQNILQHYVAIQ